ncbi:MAG: hypothetical protein LUH40_02440 [Clostridiales bacterium]|nr:hypothetical protein [Clostridiales bacterium]
MEFIAVKVPLEDNCARDCNFSIKARLSRLSSLKASDVSKYDCLASSDAATISCMLSVYSSIVCLLELYSAVKSSTLYLSVDASFEAAPYVSHASSYSAFNSCNS